MTTFQYISLKSISYNALHKAYRKNFGIIV